MTLDIIITCDIKIISDSQLDFVLTSLNNQIAVDWNKINIFIYYSNQLLSFNLYKYTNIQTKIKLQLKENAKSGDLKQLGIDQSNSDYILFLSPNFVLYSYDTLINLINLINIYNDKDCLLFDIMDGSDLSNAKGFKTCNTIWNIYGKIYNTNFIKNNLSFITELTSQEDIYFCKKFTESQAQFQIIKDIRFILLENFSQSNIIEDNYNYFISLMQAQLELNYKYHISAKEQIINIAEKLYYFINNTTNLNIVQKQQFEVLLSNFINQNQLLYNNLQSLLSHIPNIEYEEKFQTFIQRILIK